MESTDWPTLSDVIASNIRRRRKELGWNQGDLAESMSPMGWTPTTATWVETGRRQVRADELFRLCLVLGVRPDYFVEGDGNYRDQADQGPMPLDALREALGHPREAIKRDPSGQVVRDEERKAAAKIGVAVSLLRLLAGDEWDGRGLIEERDRRLGDTAGQSARSIQAKRGRITRELVDEIQERYDIKGGGKVATRKGNYSNGDRDA